MYGRHACYLGIDLLRLIAGRTFVEKNLVGAEENRDFLNLDNHRLFSLPSAQIVQSHRLQVTAGFSGAYA